jgi:hypothetical protein
VIAVGASIGSWRIAHQKHDKPIGDVVSLDLTIGDTMVRLALSQELKKAAIPRRLDTDQSLAYPSLCNSSNSVRHETSTDLWACRSVNLRTLARHCQS